MNGFWRLFLERAEVVVLVLVLELLLAKAANWIAILTRLMGAAMPGGRQYIFRSGREREKGATHCARLSEREKALLQSGHTYGRSWVWVRTCLGA